MSQSSILNSRKAIAAADKEFSAAISRGDAASITELYTEQGQLLLPNFEVATGKKQIQLMWQGTMMIGIKGIALETFELEEHSDIAYQVGKYTLLSKNVRVWEVGKYLVIWKQEAGEWKMHRDIMNSSDPAPGRYSG